MNIFKLLIILGLCLLLIGCSEQPPYKKCHQECSGAFLFSFAEECFKACMNHYGTKEVIQNEHI